MQIVKASRDALLKPLTTVSGIVERRHTLPILANLLMRKTGEVISFLATDIEIHTREMLKMKDLGNEIIAKHTGHSVEKVKADLERDFYLGAQEAIAYGVVDKIVERHQI